MIKRKKVSLFAWHSHFRPWRRWNCIAASGLHKTTTIQENAFTNPFLEQTVIQIRNTIRNLHKVNEGMSEPRGHSRQDVSEFVVVFRHQKCFISGREKCKIEQGERERAGKCLHTYLPSLNVNTSVSSVISRGLFAPSSPERKILDHEKKKKKGTPGKASLEEEKKCQILPLYYFITWPM